MLTDRLGRAHDYLRLSLTERCNLACRYCRPAGLAGRSEGELAWDEILFTVRTLVSRAGVRKVRLTGGEPLTRDGLAEGLAGLGALRRQLGFELALTTNGVHLARWLPALRDAGVETINVSIDSLAPARFHRITGVDALAAVLEGARCAEEGGFQVRYNMVVMRDMNLDEVESAAAWALGAGRHLRFIEYMPFGSNGWRSGRLVPYAETQQIISRRFELVPLAAAPHAVSMEYEAKGSRGRLGFIASMTRSFCSACNRLRVTGRGRFRPCLFSRPEDEIDLRPALTRRDEDALLAAFQRGLDGKAPGHEEPEALAARMTVPMQQIGG